jgi:hypothetical protein
MEGFKGENNREKEKGLSLVLDKDRIGTAFWGRSAEVAASELIKIFSIIKHVKEKGLKTSGEIEIMASDLFKEFNIVVLKYKAVFTNSVIDQILRSSEIDSVSLEFNEEPLVAKAGSRVESMIDEWKKKRVESPEAIAARELQLQNKKESTIKEQIILDKMISELGVVNFTDQEKLVDWLYEYYGHYSDGVDMHQNELLEKFKIHGYGPENNDAVNGMLGETLKDKKRLGEVIIGYLLTNGSLALRGNGLKNSIENWKRL